MKAIVIHAPRDAVRLGACSQFIDCRLRYGLEQAEPEYGRGAAQPGHRVFAERAKGEIRYVQFGFAQFHFGAVLQRDNVM